MPWRDRGRSSGRACSGDLAAPTLVADLAAATDGWSAAVAIGAQRVRTDPTWSPSSRSAGVSLLAGMLDPLLGDDRRSWVRLAQLPLLDRHVAELVAGAGALDRLARSSIPSRTDHGRWTVLPDAVRDALLAMDVPDGDLDTATLAAIAQHYADRGELPAAVHVATSTGDPDVLAQVLAARHWTDLEGIGLTQLSQLIDTIPDPILARHGGLLVDAARAAEAHRPALRRTWLQQLDVLDGVEPQTRRAGDAERARDIVRQVRLDDAIGLAEQVVATADPSELVALGRAKLTIAHANAFTSSEESYAIAERRFEEAADLFGLAGEHRLQAEALARLGYNVLFHQGKPAAGAAKLERRWRCSRAATGRGRAGSRRTPTCSTGWDRRRSATPRSRSPSRSVTGCAITACSRSGTGREHGASGGAATSRAWSRR